MGKINLVIQQVGNPLSLVTPLSLNHSAPQKLRDQPLFLATAMVDSFTKLQALIAVLLAALLP